MIDILSIKLPEGCLSAKALVDVGKTKRGAHAFFIRNFLIRPYLGDSKRVVPACLKRSERYFKTTFMDQTKDLSKEWYDSREEARTVIMRRMRARRLRKNKQHRK